MRKIITLALAIIIGCQWATVDAKKKQLVILHTNDTHSCIVPLSQHLADTMQAGRGGYLRRIEMIKQERKKNPKLLLIDSGDFSQGSPYYSMFKGDVEIDLMNEMKYDAATIGNHEFDFGVENMARIFRRAKFPIVCANYDFTGTACEGIVKPYTIVRRNGLKIGIFGLSPKLEGLVMAKTCKGVTYSDPIAVAQRWADYLRNDERCDLVVCISHLGWGSLPAQDQDLISKTRNIDIVLGGHSHSYLKELRWVDNADGKPVPVDQNGKNAIFVGKIVMDFSK